MDIPSQVEVMETITLNNCSEDAKSYDWNIGGYEFFFFSGSTKSTAENPTHSWDMPGTYDVTLKAYSKKEKKSDEVTESITVVDVCYECTYTSSDGSSTSSYDLCASSYTSKSDFEKDIASFESQDWTCTKQ